MDIVEYLQQKGVPLNEQQRQALLQVEGPALLLAVPGAGKTTVLTARLAHMLQNCGIPAEQTLALTFSRESARDMEARFTQLFGELFVGRPTPRFSTIHSFCYHVFRRYAQVKGQPFPQLLEGEETPVDRDRLLRDCYLQCNQEYPDEEQVQELSRLATYYVNQQQKPLDSDGHSAGLRNLTQVLDAYRRVKRENGWMDYDDLLTYTFSVFRSRSDLLEEFQAQYPYILLDEAQDTSKLQHAILRLLAAPRWNLFLVGDEDQSIYSFRGAFPQGLLRFPKEVPGTVVLRMEENFRSTGEIVERAGQVIRRNKLRYEKEMCTHRPMGQPICLTTLEDAMELGDHLAERLKELKPGETAAILYRNNPSAIALFDRFDRLGVEFYSKDKPSLLTRRAVVRDVLSIFTLYYAPDDLTAFGRIYYKVGAYISRRMFDYVSANLLAGENVFDVAARSPEENSNTARLMMVKYSIQKFGFQSPRKALDVIYYDFDYLGFLRRGTGGGMALELATQTLRALESIADGTKTLEEFIERVQSMDEIIHRASQRKNAPIILSTIHSSKGMEFDRVFLIDVQEGILPSATAIDQHISEDPEPMEEERRLFYVGITRARNQLEVVTCSKYGDTRLSPSRFLAELTQVVTDDRFFDGVRVGRPLFHRYFGKGVITRVDLPAGQFRAKFGKLGEKTLVLSILEDTTLAKLLD